MNTVIPFSSDFNHVRPEIGDDVDVPVNLDPVRHRIIALHWCRWRPIGEVAGVIVSDLRSRRLAEHQYARGLG